MLNLTAGMEALTVAADHESSRSFRFFSLPGELRNELYKCFAEAINDGRIHSSPADKCPDYNIRKHNEKNVIYPKIPAILQTSRQMREEFSPFYHGALGIKCNDFSLWDTWSHGIGKSLVANLTEVHLTMIVMVNLVHKNRAPRRMAPATLRVRYNKGPGEQTTGSHNEKAKMVGPSARFWFDLEKDSVQRAFRSERWSAQRAFRSETWYNYDCEDTPWILVPSEIGAVGRKMRRSLPWDRSLNLDDIVKLLEWISDDGVVSFCHCADEVTLGEGYPYIKQKNTFLIQEVGERRGLSTVSYPLPRRLPWKFQSGLWEREILGGKKPTEGGRYYYGSYIRQG